MHPSSVDVWLYSEYTFIFLYRNVISSGCIEWRIYKSDCLNAEMIVDGVNQS